LIAVVDGGGGGGGGGGDNNDAFRSAPLYSSKKI
jgi:hypothetical protein